MPLSKRRAARGATMVSVMLLTVSMLTVSILVIRSANRELSQANAVVSRERALMSAQATIDLGAAQLREAVKGGSLQAVVDEALAGHNPAGDPEICASAFEDCIPGGGGAANVPATGQKNRWVTGKSDCSGRPCMRQGAILRLPDAQGNLVDWANVPLRNLLDNADPHARVSLWVRNNSADAMADSSEGSGSWIIDGDNRVVLTAMATVGNSTVAVEQEFVLALADDKSSWNMATPDIGYGGGHNNDNVMADVCVENFLQ
ncbi:hypothetical protein PPSIR1_15320 [Plesiocystis pacifica SIR-1]|uniref:Type 4 fimbrial biogenesis protein PilX N-terminal domain-containing protein n=1 Tax=Plesiocystis pacifica SIR-1 TaxID=391625 RepID=A6GFI9_9BACT|nr:hypothetical protein [Plesiocystis pacifica]EDM75361.1 hypothetical protein PPSIR1_15320 [Plesiocystis pacifica SIR-1]